MNICSSTPRQHTRGELSLPRLRPVSVKQSSCRICFKNKKKMLKMTDFVVWWIQCNRRWTIRGHCRQWILQRGGCVALHSTDFGERQPLPSKRRRAQWSQGDCFLFLFLSNPEPFSFLPLQIFKPFNFKLALDISQLSFSIESLPSSYFALLLAVFDLSDQEAIHSFNQSHVFNVLLYFFSFFFPAISVFPAPVT